MPELVKTLESVYRKEERNQRFLASLQGIKLDESSSAGDGSDAPATLQEIQARATAKLTGSTEKSRAVEYGFTSDMGMSYSLIGE
jgi:hypothetical protein